MKRTLTQITKRVERNEGGLSLPELLISLVLLVVVSGAAFGALAISVKNAKEQDPKRVAAAGQNLAVYLPADLQGASGDPSKAPVGAEDPVFAACTGAGTNIFGITASVKTFKVNDAVSYRVITDGSKKTLYRYYCKNGSAPFKTRVAENVTETPEPIAANPPVYGLRVKYLDEKNVLTTMEVTGTIRTSKTGLGGLTVGDVSDTTLPPCVDNNDDGDDDDDNHSCSGNDGPGGDGDDGGHYEHEHEGNDGR